VRFRLVVPAAVLLVAAAAVTSGCNNSSSASSGPPQQTGSNGPVSVTLSEFKVAATPSSATGPKVTFDVRNAGKAPHEFVVLRTNKSAAQLGHGARIKETGHVGELGDLEPGASKTLTVNLKPGHYALVCNLPGHYMGGMHANFTVK
jgi:uncharacterized cupredoxin-like copper-binding protein